MASAYTDFSSITTAEYFCWKDSYSRGTGSAPDRCPGDKPSKEGGLCYSNCPGGYRAAGALCWRGFSAARRSVGTPSESNDGYEKNQGLCYRKCRPTYSGNGPVCWKNCDGFTPTGCGAGCATSVNACAKSITDKSLKVFQSVFSIGQLFATGGTSAWMSAVTKNVGREAAINGASALATYFKQQGYSQQEYNVAMTSAARRMGQNVNSRGLDVIYGAASPSQVATVAASLAATIDPTGLAEVVIAFANNSC